MMEGFNIDNYLENLISRCKESFGSRLVYVGLQGSWLRGEATENSDIDVMIVIDGFSVEDMKTYRDILKEIGWFEKSCGFICAKEDLANWNSLESLQLKFLPRKLSSLYSWWPRKKPCQTPCKLQAPDDCDFEKTYEAVITWCQKAFFRLSVVS